MEPISFKTVEKFAEYFGVRPGVKGSNPAVRKSSVNVFYRHPEDEYRWDYNTSRSLKMKMDGCWKTVHSWILQIMKEDCITVSEDFQQIYFYLMQLFLEDYELESDAAFDSFDDSETEDFNNVFSILDFAIYSKLISQKFEGLNFQKGDLELIRNSILGSGKALYCFYRDILPESNLNSALDFECGPVVKRILEIHAVENDLTNLGIDSLNNIFRPYIGRIGGIEFQ